MKKVVLKLKKIFGFMDKTLTILDVLALIFVMLISVGAVLYFLVTLVFK